MFASICSGPLSHQEPEGCPAPEQASAGHVMPWRTACMCRQLLMRPFTVYAQFLGSARPAVAGLARVIGAVQFLQVPLKCQCKCVMLVGDIEYR